MDERTFRPAGGKVREQRKRKGWTQRILANKSGVDIGTIRKIEASRPVFPTSLAAVAGALGVDLEELLVSERPLALTASEAGFTPPMNQSRAPNRLFDLSLDSDSLGRFYKFFQKFSTIFSKRRPGKPDREAPWKNIGESTIELIMHGCRSHIDVED